MLPETFLGKAFQRRDILRKVSRLPFAYDRFDFSRQCSSIAVRQPQGRHFGRVEQRADRATGFPRYKNRFSQSEIFIEFAGNLQSATRPVASDHHRNIRAIHFSQGLFVRHGSGEFHKVRYPEIFSEHPNRHTVARFRAHVSESEDIAYRRAMIRDIPQRS